MGTASGGRLVGTALLAAAFLLTAARPATAQDEFGVWRFLAGGVLALGMHEAGHLVFDVAFDASPGLDSVRFGPLPFFAITHAPVSPARELVIASAGFWMQHASSEILLTRHPRLRHERASLEKGVLAFNVLASVAYAGATFARAGPAERDTRAISQSADVGEPLVGVFLLAPAVADAARYYRPDSRWLAWTSRAAKIGGVLLIVRAAR